MVTSLRFWAEAARVIQSSPSGTWSVTPFGSAVFGEDGYDPFLDELETLWLAHWHITSLPESPLFAWEVLFSRWVEPDFTRARALEELSRLSNLTGRVISEVTLTQHFDVFLRTYVPSGARRSAVVEESLDSPLTELELIRPAGERRTPAGLEVVYDFARAERPSLTTATIAYCLADYWARVRPSEATLSFYEVTTSPGCIGQVFRMTEPDIRRHLEALEESTGGVMRYRPSATVPAVTKVGHFKSEAFLRRVYHRGAGTDDRRPGLGKRRSVRHQGTPLN